MSQGAVNILIVSAISRLGLVHNLYIFGYVIAFSFKSGKTLVFCWKKLDPSLYCYITILWRWYRHHWWWWCPPPPPPSFWSYIDWNRGVLLIFEKNPRHDDPFFGLRKTYETWIQQRLEYTMCVHRVGLTSRGAHTLISQGFPNTHTHTHTHTHMRYTLNGFRLSLEGAAATPNWRMMWCHLTCCCETRNTLGTHTHSQPALYSGTWWSIDRSTLVLYLPSPHDGQVNRNCQFGLGMAGAWVTIH